MRRPEDQVQSGEWIDFVIDEQRGFLQALEFIRDVRAHDALENLSMIERMYETQPGQPEAWRRGALIAVALVRSKF